MDERGPVSSAYRLRRRKRVFEVSPASSSLRAVVLGRLDLRHRRVERDVDARADAGLARGPRHRLAVVAGARRDDAGGALLVVEQRDPVDRAADLECARALEVLGLQPDVRPARRDNVSEP